MTVCVDQGVLGLERSHSLPGLNNNTAKGNLLNRPIQVKSVANDKRFDVEVSVFFCIFFLSILLKLLNCRHCVKQ